MPKRFLSLWFPFLHTDRLAIRKPALRDQAFVFASPQRGRMTITASSLYAVKLGIRPGMAVADARALKPDLLIFPEKPGRGEKLLRNLAEWCLCYTPVAAIDPPDGLVLEISGCPHLWGGEESYLRDLTTTLRSKGYHNRAAIADTIGTAWGMARHHKTSSITARDKQRNALQTLPPAALRLDAATLERMEKLGFRQIGQFIDIPIPTLRKRFGEGILVRLEQALGTGHEPLEPITPQEPYLERLPCMDPIRTAPGIKIALEELLNTICKRLSKEKKGMRKGIFRGHRLDGKVEEISIGTHLPSYNPKHLFRLFELKIPNIEPDLGIELFEIEALLVEKISETQESLWQKNENDVTALSELLDKMAGKMGPKTIHRYLPQEQHWPEHSIREAHSLEDKPSTEWTTERARPLHLLSLPERIDVMVPLPDYPPLHFRYRGEILRVAKADGPERIEQEWWQQSGPPRDYYVIEDEHGKRYWLFRLGLYGKENPQWFIHGFFA
ncbi:DNA polymerase Y family protein [Algoriphagus aestuariicola]|uniref:DNA polymerase Y family protein n=1 Tax=Algoriphagus aestuariicola TaxID=1852016 RepID=A0ABS3BW70_9BACT|nr:DNA polymerase Y family protein [Algoriphagus aestuariicola]MBN7803486.1 DNA polymerase Y family protein [Algoriphagus aestuariicola]